jgi:hypothetical protein
VVTLFFPLALASLVWPAISHWCRRLVETVAALVLSKFVIVAVLSLAVGALGTAGGSLSSELAGGALLLLAGFAPFTLLRLVPMVESGAAHQLEGVRHRVQHNVLAGPRSAVQFALGHRAAESLPELAPGTGVAALADAPGGDGVPPGTPDRDNGPTGEPAGVGVPMWRGSSTEIPAATSTRPGPGASDRRGPPPIWGAPLGSTDSVPSRKGDHVVESDDLGPVLRWRPAAQPEQPVG